jgi:hypothetical protein
MQHTTIPKYKPYLEEFYKLFLSGPLTLQRWTQLTHLVAIQAFPSDPDAANKFKGDHLEILAEGWFEAFGPAPDVGLLDYSPAPANTDFGVDGLGTNTNGEFSVVQVKYRSNPQDIITYADLARTAADGVYNFGLVPNVRGSIWLFTNADGASNQAHQFFGNSLVVLDRAAVRNRIDNNKMFWRRFVENLL